MYSDSIQNTPLLCYTCCYRAFIFKTMIRFVEMTGIYLDDKKSFGFLNTVNDTFLNMNGCHYVDSVKEFEDMYSPDCGYDYERLKGLIPQKWLDYVEEDV